MAGRRDGSSKLGEALVFDDIGLIRLLGETLTGGYSGTKYHRNLTNKHTKKRYIRAINNLRILIKSPCPKKLVSLAEQCQCWWPTQG